MTFKLENAMLYIDDDASLDGVVARIAELTSGKASALGRISTGLTTLRVERSQTSDARRKTESDSFVYYTYRCVIDPKEAATEALFVNEVCRLVEKLRLTGAKVVVTSDFNDQIVARTGWNWSKETPVHPVYD